MPDNWRSVEIKHLRALGAIADTGTFWAASEQLNSSLSTVSDHITALEALVGERLIERSRGRRSVEVTEAGRVLLGHAEAIESRLRAAEADFRAYAAGQSGSLRIGIYQSVANKVLPEVMRRFQERWPEGEVQVTAAAHDREQVGAGLGFALAPLRAVDENDRKIRLLQIAEPVPPRVLVVVWHRDRYRPPAAAAFVETAIAVASEIERAHAVFLARSLRSVRSRR